MNKFEAKRLLEELSEVQDSLDDIVKIANSIQSESDREKLIRSLGDVMSSINSDLIFYICDQYPDLNPYIKK